MVLTVSSVMLSRPSSKAVTIMRASSWPRVGSSIVWALRRSSSSSPPTSRGLKGWAALRGFWGWKRCWGHKQDIHTSKWCSPWCLTVCHQPDKKYLRPRRYLSFLKNSVETLFNLNKASLCRVDCENMYLHQISVERNISSSLLACQALKQSLLATVMALQPLEENQRATMNKTYKKRCIVKTKIKIPQKWIFHSPPN